MDDAFSGDTDELRFPVCSSYVNVCPHLRNSISQVNKFEIATSFKCGN